MVFTFGTQLDDILCVNEGGRKADPFRKPPNNKCENLLHDAER